MRWKAQDSRGVALSRRSYGGRNGDSMSLPLRLHKVSAIGCSREGKSRESLFWNKIDVRHDGSVSENSSLWHRDRQFGMRHQL